MHSVVFKGRLVKWSSELVSSDLKQALLDLAVLTPHCHFLVHKLIAIIPVHKSNSISLHPDRPELAWALESVSLTLKISSWCIFFLKTGNKRCRRYKNSLHEHAFQFNFAFYLHVKFEQLFQCSFPVWRNINVRFFLCFTCSWCFKKLNKYLLSWVSI